MSGFRCESTCKFHSVVLSSASLGLDINAEECGKYSQGRLFEGYTQQGRGECSDPPLATQRILQLPLFHLAIRIKPLELRITTQNGEVGIAACPG